MSNKENTSMLSDLYFRLQRIEKELLCTEMKYKQALANHKSADILEEMRLDIDNLKRKLSWFSCAIKKCTPRHAS